MLSRCISLIKSPILNRMAFSRSIQPALSSLFVREFAKGSNSTKKGGGGGGGGGNSGKKGSGNNKAVEMTDEERKAKGLPPRGEIVDVDVLENDMEEYFDKFKIECDSTRPGRADTRMFDHIMVEAYGVEQPLKSMGQIVVKSAQLVSINMFDPSLSSKVMDALKKSKMDLNPELQGQSINIPISKSSKETREALVKKLKEKVELTMKNIRNVRADGLKLLGKSVGVAEDELYKTRNDIQDATDKWTNKAKDLFDKKKDELMNL